MGGCIGPVALVDVDATLTDPDSANLASLTVTITNLLDGSSEVLAADTAGTSITASYNPGTGVLSLTGSDTVANYEQALRTITYDNAEPLPDATPRIVTFQASDGANASLLASTTVSIQPVNEAPSFLVGDGIVTTPIGPDFASAHDVHVLSDGRILVAGATNALGAVGLRDRTLQQRRHAGRNLRSRGNRYD